MNEKEFTIEFFNFLRGRGYPENSIIFEPAVHGAKGRGIRPDVLIIDPARNEKLAVIEIKSGLPKQGGNLGQQLQAYKNAIGEPGLQFYLVVVDTAEVNPHSFNLYVIDESGEFEFINLGLFPSFHALASIKIADKKISILKSFDFHCRTLSAILFGLAMADFICARMGVTVLTTERFGLVGASVLLFLVPYTQKFKGLGFKWERFPQKEK